MKPSAYLKNATHCGTFRLYKKMLFVNGTFRLSKKMMFGNGTFRLSKKYRSLTELFAYLKNAVR